MTENKYTVPGITQPLYQNAQKQSTFSNAG